LAEGELPDGSQFSRVLTVSIWVGVKVDLDVSPANVNYNVPAPQGMLAAEICILPMDRQKELLGPFRTSQVRFTTTQGSFPSDTESRPDGRYCRRLVFRRDQRPIVTITVQDQSVMRRIRGPGTVAR
jgi:hypothetical protein